MQWNASHNVALVGLSYVTLIWRARYWISIWSSKETSAPSTKILHFHQCRLYGTFTKSRRLDIDTHQRALLNATVSTSCYEEFLRAHNMEAPGSHRGLPKYVPRDSEQYLHQRCKI